MKVAIMKFVFIAATLMPNLESCQPCPIFWVPYQGNCYQIFTDTLTWLEAEKKCNSYTTSNAKGHLVAIRSDEENKFVSVLWNSATDGLVTGSYGTYWIGLAYVNFTRSWLWTDNNQLATYTNWDVNEPNNFKGYKQDCVTVWNRHGLQTKWDDEQCHLKRGHVCELSRNND